MTHTIRLWTSPLRHHWFATLRQTNLVTHSHYWLDPAVAMGISLVIMVPALRLLIDAKAAPCRKIGVGQYLNNNAVRLNAAELA
jgi:Co/Zn/Cd efflux system component